MGNARWAGVTVRVRENAREFRISQYLESGHPVKMHTMLQQLKQFSQQ